MTTIVQKWFELKDSAMRKNSNAGVYHNCSVPDIAESMELAFRCRALLFMPFHGIVAYYWLIGLKKNNKRNNNVDRQCIKESLG